MTTATMEATQRRGPVSGIISLAATGLTGMYDPAQKLFVHLVRESNGVLVPEGISPRYSLMTLLGLHRMETKGRNRQLPSRRVLDRLVSDTSWIPGVGDLGLLLWSVAVISPERFTQVASKLDVHTALERYKDGRRRSTMELAWFLTGLSYGVRLGQKGTTDFLEDARSVYELLKKNQGPGGTFGHLAAAGIHCRSIAWQDWQFCRPGLSHLRLLAVFQSGRQSGAARASLWVALRSFANCKAQMGNGGGTTTRRMERWSRPIRFIPSTRMAWLPWRYLHSAKLRQGF